MFDFLFKDCLPVLEEYAPLIAKAIGFPNAGAIAFSILNQIFNLTNNPVGHTPDIINKSDPDVLRNAERMFLDWLIKNISATGEDGKMTINWH